MLMVTQNATKAFESVQCDVFMSRNFEQDNYIIADDGNNPGKNCVMQIKLLLSCAPLPTGGGGGERGDHLPSTGL